MKVLNLYAGIGGNRKLWDDVEVTAVEWDQERALIYQRLHPQDTLLVEDAHDYLLKYFNRFDFIWSSPPCPTHSKIRNQARVGSGQSDPVYADMTLYQEIILLTHYFKGLWVVENVEPYYTPLIKGVKRGRHMFWANFQIGRFQKPKGKPFLSRSITSLKHDLGMNIELGAMPTYKKRQTLANCVHPDLGKHILDCARNKGPQPELIKMTQSALL